MSHKSDVSAYVSGVISGDITAGRFVVMACDRYLRDIERIGTGVNWYFDEQIASNFIDFISELEHTKGKWAGKKFILSPCQKFIIWNLFGFRRVDTGFRRFKDAYMTVGRKFGKSTFVCAIALGLMFFDTPIEAESEGYVVATCEDQAARITTQADKMIQRHGQLREMSRSFKYRNTIKSIVIEAEPYNGSVFRALGSDSRTADSLNPAFIIKDELHEFREFHRELIEKLDTGGGSREQPLDMTITTAGSDQSKIWIEKDDYCTKVLQSEKVGRCTDDECFAFIARIDEARPCECGGTDAACGQCGGHGEIPGDDPFDEDCWQKANPDVGVTPSWEYLQSNANKAKHSPSFKQAWLRYHVNSKVRSVHKVIDYEAWDKCQGELSVWTGNSCGGWDIGWRDDLASIAAVYKNADGVFEIRQRAYCPEDGPRNLSLEPWATWIEQGYLVATPGNTTDIAMIKLDIIEWSGIYGVKEWAFDPSNSRQLGTELLNDHGINVYEFQQSHANYNEPTREYLQQLANQNLLHDGDPVLAWAADNLVVSENSKKHRMPAKEKSIEKIDPQVSVIMAFARASFAPQRKKSIYETRGVIGG